jgi:hypothetical protein
MWEKKYALGSFMRDPLRNIKYKRSKFISDIGGYGPFKKLWATTFYFASLLWPVSHVSVKAESLPEKKWAANMVRTITGSPISQYILSTIWNYGPNHRFSWESTPIKIGMPLNGYWMSRIWDRHSRCQIHVEGDFSRFDSTLSGAIIPLIKKVRAKGYELHKDKVRIADLIDINYDQISNQLLNTTTTGGIYLKGTGLTTGHSSTSMDNSVALVILYLMAWKELTGLSAREFLHFNELSCFGDDHFLSILQVRPLTWTPANIRKVMSKWGLTNNLSVKRLQDISFLSKCWRPATSADLKHLKEAGVSGFRSIVWHSRERLIGKLTAPVKSLNPTYRLKRLVSYMSLTAHHPDIYTSLVRIIFSSRTMKNIIKNDHVRIPTYVDVMRNWYTSSMGSQPVEHLDEEVDEVEKTGKLIEYGSVTLGDSVLNALSMIPDLLNPVMFNYGYVTSLQLRMRPFLNWAIDYIANQNGANTVGVLRKFLWRTPYRFLDPTLFSVGCSGFNQTELLVRHWLFLMYVRIRPQLRGFALVNFALTRIASFQFVLNGKLLSEQRQSDFQLDLLLVVAFVHLLPPLPDWLKIVSTVTLPDVNMLLDLMFHFLLVTVWTTVPPNYREVEAVVKNLGTRTGSILIEAATGTGKSTAMIAFLYTVFGHKFDKIIVIEPRSLLVHGLVPYMRKTYGILASGGTTGMQIDKNAKVFYMTPQSFFGNMDLVSKRTLLVLDECHLAEEFYAFFRGLLHKHNVPYLMTSATPSLENIDHAGVHVKLDQANIFSRTEDVVDMSKTPCATIDKSPSACLVHYKQWVNSFIEALPPSSKILVCVPRVSDVEELVVKCPLQAVGLSSRHPLPSSWHESVYFSTAVSDVGLTIDGLTHVVTCDFTLTGEKDWRGLSPSLLQQRFGRVGRTSNGRAILVRYNLPLEKVANNVELDPKSLGNMIFSGLPPEIAFSFSRDQTARAIGLDPGGIPEESWPEIVRAAHVFIGNVKPIIASHVAASVAEQQVYGTPAILHSTGVANISSTWPTDPIEVQKKVKESLGAIIAANLSGLPLDPVLLNDPFFTAAGPILAMKNLAVNLAQDLKDGITDLFNPQNPSENSIQEMVNIVCLLEKLSST